MSTFWFNLLYLITVWILAIYQVQESDGFTPLTILLSALFFTLYFCLPLVEKYHRIFQWTLTFLSILVYFTFSQVAFNGFILLIILINANQAIDQLRGWRLYLQLFIQYIVIISPYLRSSNFMMITYISLLILLISFLFVNRHLTNQLYTSLNDRHLQLETDYRHLKRHAIMHEKNVRQEERNQIAREIHDSVGHRLTALLMQLEVARIQAPDSDFQEKFDQLKSLAQTSLDDTREAVKTLKSEETTGSTAVIQLIRKLEAESHLLISILVQSGAVSVPLTNDQSIALYRSVQEGLTNMMRHSEERQASVDFNVVGGRYFRFQISHPLKKRQDIREGFGLKSMRERLEQLSGSLKINQVDGEFRLIGTFPLEEGG